MGALTPSGERLAQAMAEAVSACGSGLVVELGGGTGALTRALLASGVAPERLIVVERDRKLCRLLRRRFPAVRILERDARTVRDALGHETPGTVAAVVSSLPLLSMPPAMRRAILTEAFGLMDEDGVFAQFTYGISSPVPSQLLECLGLQASAAARVWLNLPPAQVWLYRHAAHGSQH